VLNINIDDVKKYMIEGIINRETVVLFGSGISRDSGMPVVDDFLKYLFDKNKLSEYISEEDKKAITNNGFLPFESYMETLINVSRSKKICNIFLGGSPNTKHIFLAKLIKNKIIKNIVTTNFDVLLEKALYAEGARENTDYVIKHDYKEFNAIPWDDSKAVIVKIHGCITNLNSIAIMLHQVASGILSATRAPIIDQIFNAGEHKNILILGYSCSDVFDISPQIEKNKYSPKTIYLIDHNKDLFGDKAWAEEIQKKQENNPFKKFGKGFRLYADTKHVVKLLWSYLLKDDYSEQSSENDIWKSVVESWWIDCSEIIGKDSVGIITGILFLKKGRLDVSENIFQLAVGKPNNIFSTQICRLHLSIIYYLRENYKAALKQLDMLPGQLDVIEDKELALRNKLYRAKIQNKLGENDDAEKLFKEILNLTKDYSRDEAARNFTMGYSDELVASCKGELANICYERNDFEEAERLYKEAYTCSKNVGDMTGNINWLAKIGNTLCSKEQYGLAYPKMTEALKLAQLIGDTISEGWIHNYLGDIYLYWKDRIALEHFRSAINLLGPIFGKNSEQLRKIHEQIAKYKAPFPF
jgi:tetratricopeptide (TPR) repeat protein